MKSVVSRILPAYCHNVIRWFYCIYSFEWLKTLIFSITGE